MQSIERRYMRHSRIVSLQPFIRVIRAIRGFFPRPASTAVPRSVVVLLVTALAAGMAAAADPLGSDAGPCATASQKQCPGPQGSTACLTASGGTQRQSNGTQRPNVLFLFTDDQREDTIHALGNPHVKTPNLDKLVQSGLAFRNAYCMGGYSGAVCLPSREMLMTGRAWFAVRGLSKDAPNLPRSINEAGYLTYHYGKRGNTPVAIQALFTHNRYLQNNEDRTTGYPCRTIADAAIAFLKDYEKSKARDPAAAKPLFMYLAFANPHDPRVAAKEYLDQYDPANLPLPPNFKPFHPLNNGELLIRDERLAPWPRPEANIRAQIRDYYAVITAMDGQIGRILDCLREIGQYDNTIVIFSSDQGIALGSHGLMGKQNLYEHSMGVPLVLSGPGIPRGRSSDAPAYLLDVYPTICELVGAKAPAGLDGKSLAPVIRGETPQVRDTIFLAYRNVQRAVRHGRWKLIRYPQINRTQLFDLQEDPLEINDLSADPAQAARIKELMTRLDQQQRLFGDKLALTSDKPAPAEVNLDFFKKQPPEKPKARKTKKAARSRAAGGTPPAPKPGFTDVTAESGVGKIVEDHYAAHPKWWLSGVHLVDLDGDGNLDLFLSAHGSGPAVAALGDGTGRFTLAPGKYPSSEVHLAYDGDEDGRVDLTMTYQDGGGQWWRNRSRPGTLDFQPTGITRGTNTARRQAMIDIDRDGRVDWLRGSGTGIHFDLGDGKGGFAEGGASIAFGIRGQAERLCLPVDVDGDGQIDLLTEWGHYAQPDGNSRIYRNDGHMHFIDVTAEAGLAEKGISIKGAGDVNQDGYVDLICLENRQRLEIYLNDGHGRFTKREGAIQGVEGRFNMASWGIAVVTDFDNDGIADIILNGKNFLKLLRGTGGGNFTYMNRQWGIADFAASSIDDGLCFGDIDNDGDLDIIGYSAIGDRRRLAVYRNDLPAQHWLRVRPVGLPGNRGAAGAKIRIYAAGSPQLLWFEQVAIYDSQAAASCYGLAQTERHFGLGKRTAADLSVEFYPSGKTVRRRGVAADRTVVIREDGAPTENASP